MKRAISISLALILILSLFTSCKQKTKDNGNGLAQSDFVSTEQNKSFIYDVYKDYTVIKEYIGEDFRVSIPNRLGGKPVKGIGENAIGKSALAIDIVDIPKNVEFIDPSAFYGNHLLTAFTVASGNDNYKSEKGVIYSKDGKALSRDDFARTKHPIYSFAVWGKGKEELCAMDNKSSFGIDSPFTYMTNHEFKNLFIDKDLGHSFVYVHYVEEQVGNIPYRYLKDFTADYIDEDGNINREKVPMGKDWKSRAQECYVTWTQYSKKKDV